MIMDRRELLYEIGIYNENGVSNRDWAFISEKTFLSNEFIREFNSKLCWFLFQKIKS
jgi:hypothetical protein